MNCSPTLKEVLDNYINFRYKLDDTLKEISPNQKFTANQLYSYLTKRGISPKEIKQSKIFDIPDKDTPAKASTWLNELKLAGNQHHLGSATSDKYSKITLGEEGIDTQSYKVNIDTIKNPKENAPELDHFKYIIPDKSSEEFLQKRLKHLEIQKVLWTKDYIKKYPREYQNYLNTVKETKDKLNRKGQTILGWNRTHIDSINGKKTLVLNEFQSDWAQTERAGRGKFTSHIKPDSYYEGEIRKIKDAMALLRKQGGDNAKELKNLSDKETALRIDRVKNNNSIADFPMSEQKHHQYQIVKAIDEAMKHHINRVAIPINRENELVGDAGVTKFYDSLNKKILPDIRKKLEKQGLRIKISKEGYKGPNTINELHMLTIEEIPNKPVNWNIYSLLGALGLGSLANKEKSSHK